MLRKFSKTTHRKPSNFTVTTRTAICLSKSIMRPWPCRAKHILCARIYPLEWGWPGLSFSRACKQPVYGMTETSAWPRIWAKIINVIENQMSLTKMKSTRTRSCRRYALLKSRVTNWASPPNPAATLSKLEGSFVALIKYLIPDRLIIINGHF